MNKKQKAKRNKRRRHAHPYGTGKSLLIRNWGELRAIPQESETHILTIEKGCGRLDPKVKLPETSRANRHYNYGHYLSTHTFYGGTHKWSTRILQQCGFDVIIDNWDKEERS